MKPRFGILVAAGFILACNRYELRPMDPRECPPDPPPRDTLRLSPAPTQPGTVLGVITDQASGRPLAGAQVVIYALHQVATSDTAGAFRLASLPIGSHDIIVRLVGYEQRILADVHVSDAGGVRARVPLQASVMDGCPGFAAVRVHKPWWKW